MTKVLKTYSGGNSTITLTKPGERYFVCGNKLHCLGGMKLQVNVENNQAYAPAGAPQSATGYLEQGQGSSNINPKPSSKTNLPTSSATAFAKSEIFVFAYLCLLASMLFTLKI